VVLETTGRRTGLLRQVPLVATRLGDRLVVSTVRTGSEWIGNLEANPTAGVWLNGRRRAATAQVRRGPLNVVQLVLGDPVPPVSPAA
jgi:deazaflavin-dependent oxidoreductase (nitroreductase family)